MAVYGRPRLRDLFDDAPTPHIAHPPHTHHRDYYVATDGSFVDEGGGIGAIIETRDGQRLHRLARRDDAPDNNVAEYRALHLGLDALAERESGTASVGVLVDHNDLAANVNAAAIGTNHPDWPADPITVPDASQHHWRGIRARIHGFADIRAACIPSRENPAHVLANAPMEFVSIDDRPAGQYNAKSDGEIPPPSRADRHASDD